MIYDVAEEEVLEQGQRGFTTGAESRNCLGIQLRETYTL